MTFQLDYVIIKMCKPLHRLKNILCEERENEKTFITYDSNDVIGISWV
jgi:hypothetical protein